jgi:hypothetical protein
VHDRGVIDDAVLPAAAHLTGPSAPAVLRAAVEAANGRLLQSRACHLQYRPGHDVVVRFDSRVAWNGGPPVAETLVAATTVGGPPPGTLPVEAVTPDGSSLAVGVWRWPFDPHVTGLECAVTPSTAADFLHGLVSGSVRLEVVAYRPTLRAVVRVVDEHEDVVYVKAVPPADVGDLMRRHERLLAGGIRVPRIVRWDASAGLIAMTALTGPTVRDLIKSGRDPLPGADQYEALYAAFAPVHLPGARLVQGRAAMGLRHAAMLATVMAAPQDQQLLDRLHDALAPVAARATARSGPTIHGDLYEAQLVTRRGEDGTPVISGLLDLDEAGPGDPFDGRATVIAHLLCRALDSTGPDRRRLDGYAGALRGAFGRRVDLAELDLVTAGALIGLATGPFRAQQRRWRPAVRRRLRLAERLCREAGERTLSIAS